MSVQGVKNIANVPELWRKLGWTILILVLYRLGIHVPVPGVDTVAMASAFEKASETMLGMLNMLSGGGLRNISIFALGVMPYISASIIIQLLQVVVPELKRLAKEEGANGRKKITQYTRYLTVLITVVQGFGVAKALETMGGGRLVANPGLQFEVITIITLTAGTVLIMWLGEQITSRGLGNGISLIIFSGIVAGLPNGIMRLYDIVPKLPEGGRNYPGIALMFLVILVCIIAMTLIIVFLERAQRRVPVHYAKRQQGRKMYGGQTTHLPLRLNTAGVIPPIFAGSILAFPATIAQVSSHPVVVQIRELFKQGSWFYTICFILLIVFFCYFYTAIIFDPKDIAENLKKQGGFVPGIRPGEKTREYIDGVLTRITLWGAIYITLVCVVPQFLAMLLKTDIMFGGTSILIVVGVAMDFMSQVNSYLISSQYEGLMGKAKLKGRMG